MSLEILNMIRGNMEMPYYSAETRLSIFVQYYLHDLLRKHYRNGIKCVVPEFPLKQNGSNRADNVDFLCVANGKPIFLELKTDSKSLKSSQANNYVGKHKKWPICIEKFKELALNANVSSKDRVKYYYVAKELILSGLVVCDDFNEQNTNIVKLLTATSRSEKKKRTLLISEVFQNIKSTIEEVEVLYLIPDRLKAKNKFSNNIYNKIKIIEFSELPKELIKPTSPADQEIYTELLNILQMTE